MNPLRRFRAALRVLIRGETVPQPSREIPPITPEEVEQIRHFFRRPKFFIFGHARSGTTLLARLIRLHPEVHCNWQAHFFTRPPFLKSLVDSPAIQEWLTRRSNRWNQGGDLSPLVLRAVADVIMEREAEELGKRIVGDKSPSSLIHGQAVRNLYAVYPDASLIYIVRDGRDVAISERFRNFVEDSQYLTSEDHQILEALKRDSQPFVRGERSIFTEAALRRLANSWVENLNETETEGRRLFGERFFTLRYEDLLVNPFEEMTRLWQFLGVEVTPDLAGLIAQEMASNPDEEWQARRKGEIASFLPKGQAGNWQRLFTERDRALFREIAGEMLKRWGYDW
ncbi:MAG: sulfotransferase family protein [Anaerolineales bacterium]